MRAGGVLADSVLDDEEEEKLRKAPVSLTASEDEEFERLAKERGKSRQWVVRRLYEVGRQHGELPKQEPADRVFPLRLPESEVEALDAEATAKGHSRSSAIQFFVREGYQVLKRELAADKALKKKR